MKPNWRNAPEWANWIAFELPYGQAWWFEFEPELYKGIIYQCDIGRVLPAEIYCLPDIAPSLERRP
jgi:hypothetical protein